MMARISWRIVGVNLFVCAFCTNPAIYAQKPVWGIFPEQRHVPYHDPIGLPRARISASADPPPTVSRRGENPPQSEIDLDGAIRLALSNADVIRVLTGAGAGAVGSGQTIYDPAIATTRIDQQQSEFDPTVNVRNDFLRDETPFASLRPRLGGQPFINGTRDDRYDLRVDAGKKTITGGRLDAMIDANRGRQRPNRRILDPQSRSSAALRITQPILNGAGIDVNLVPIVLARIDAESSYFRLKGAVQETVRGVIQAYWDLVAARTQVWANEQQVEQSEFAVRLESARMRVGTSNQGQFSQAKLALTNFRANLIASRSLLLDREAALRAMMGLPPTSPDEMIPMTPPVILQYDFDWNELLQLAEQNRPDLVELKLVLEADYQQLLLSKNQALPQLDAVALYRWNGLEGELPSGATLRSEPGAFTDWQLGINFSVPIGLRAGRAGVRESKLLIARDQVNLQQAMLEIVHEVAASLRQLDQQFAQYEALRETRLAAIDNLRQQTAGFRNESVNFINVLQALTDWGNSVRAEAQSLSQYNSELARLEQVTGTILEEHGIRFYEERFQAAAPLGLLHHTTDYPEDLRPTPNTDRYDESDRPVDELFREDAPDDLIRRDRDIRVLPSPDVQRLPPVPTPGNNGSNPLNQIQQLLVA